MLSPEKVTYPMKISTKDSNLPLTLTGIKISNIIIIQ